MSLFYDANTRFVLVETFRLRNGNYGDGISKADAAVRLLSELPMIENNLIQSKSPNLRGSRIYISF